MTTPTTYVSEDSRSDQYVAALERVLEGGDWATYFLLLEMRRIIGFAAFGLNVFDTRTEYDTWAQEVPKETEDVS
jgi:hypothetical protein